MAVTTTTKVHTKVAIGSVDDGGQATTGKSNVPEEFPPNADHTEVATGSVDDGCQPTTGKSNVPDGDDEDDADEEEDFTPSKKKGTHNRVMFPSTSNRSWQSEAAF